MKSIRWALEACLRIAAIGVLGLLAHAPGAAAERWGSPQDLEFRSATDGSVQRYVELLPEPFDATRKPLCWSSFTATGRTAGSTCGRTAANAGGRATWH